MHSQHITLITEQDDTQYRVGRNKDATSKNTVNKHKRFDTKKAGKTHNIGRQHKDTCRFLFHINQTLWCI